MTEVVQMVVGFAVILVGGIALFSYPALQYAALRQYRGVWFALGLVPLGVMGVVLAVTAVALSQGSNLWPIVLIFTAPLATVYLVILRFAAGRVRRD